MALDSSSTIAKRDLDEMISELKDARKFLSAVEKIGCEIPSPLTASLKNLERALKTGRAIGEAATEASKELDRFTSDLKSVCKKVDNEQDLVCEAKVERLWMFRSVKFTLDPVNKNSVVSKLVEKAIKSYTPSLICKHWLKCAQIAK